MLGVSTTSGDITPGGFSVVAARTVLFNRLPEELRRQTAYRHFYTDTLHPTSHLLSLKFFSLFVAFFCALCRLEGRRSQYVEHESDKSGHSFARAHRKARALYQRLCATYAEILLRYNTHSSISYEESRGRAKRELSKTGDLSVRSTAQRRVVPAFQYVATELRFYEELYTFTEQMLRIAFSDARLQLPIAQEVNRIFRSDSFNFPRQQREAKVQEHVRRLDRGDEASLLQNHARLAAVLEEPPAKLMVKYATVQRTPLIGCRYPAGAMNSLRYQRLFNAEGDDGDTDTGDKKIKKIHRPSDPSAAEADAAESDVEKGDVPRILSAFEQAERAFILETRKPMFPPNHRAVRPISPPGGRTTPAVKTGVAVRVGKTPWTAAHPRQAGEPGKGPTGLGGKTAHTDLRKQPHTFLPMLHDYEDAGGDGCRPEDVASPRSDDATADDIAAIARLARSGYTESGPREPTTVVVPPPGAVATDEGFVKPVAGPSVMSRLKGRVAEIGRVAGAARRFSGSLTAPLQPTVGSDHGSPTLASPSFPAGGGATGASFLSRTVGPGMSTSGAPQQKTSLAELARIEFNPETGTADWTRWNPNPEIEKVLQSLAVGELKLTGSSFRLPLDIQCEYDDVGILVRDDE